MKNIWSNIFLALGVLTAISSVNLIDNGDNFVNQLNAGIIIIIGVLAYKSAKKRKAKEVLGSKLRLGMELLGIAAIFLLVGLQNNLVSAIIENPLVNFIIPLIAITAYSYKAFITKK